MNQPRVKILLLSLSTNGSSQLRAQLGECGYECWDARTTSEALDLVGREEFDFALSARPLRQTATLHSLLSQSNCSVFFRLPVEDGFWWIPVLRLGRNCLGAPALRPNQLLDTLDGAARDIEPGERNEDPCLRKAEPGLAGVLTAKQLTFSENAVSVK